jgi:hypothetical protein
MNADRWDVFLIIPAHEPQKTAIDISRTLGHRSVSNAILIDLHDSDFSNDRWLSYIVASSDFERWAIKIVPFVEELAAGVDPWIQINLPDDVFKLIFFVSGVKLKPSKLQEIKSVGAVLDIVCIIIATLSEKPKTASGQPFIRLLVVALFFVFLTFAI